MEFLIYVALVIASVIPLFKLLPRYGIHPFWSFVSLLMPLGVIVLLWVMAARGGNDGAR